MTIKERGRGVKCWRPLTWIRVRVLALLSYLPGNKVLQGQEHLSPAQKMLGTVTWVGTVPSCLLVQNYRYSLLGSFFKINLYFLKAKKSFSFYNSPPVNVDQDPYSDPVNCIMIQYKKSLLFCSVFRIRVGSGFNRVRIRIWNPDPASEIELDKIHFFCKFFMIFPLLMIP